MRILFSKRWAIWCKLAQAARTSMTWCSALRFKPTLESVSLLTDISDFKMKKEASAMMPLFFDK
jgi:hypothetical protein